MMKNSMRRGENKDITKVQKKEVHRNMNGSITTVYSSLFTDEEKVRASKIIEPLKGLTIREAQELLEKVSEALIDVHTF